jgi:hypothetical protein
VTVLADTAIRGKDLDEAKAAEAKKRAEEALANNSPASTTRKRKPNWQRPSASWQRSPNCVRSPSTKQRTKQHPKKAASAAFFISAAACDGLSRTRAPAGIFILAVLSSKNPTARARPLFFSSL